MDALYDNAPQRDTERTTLIMLPGAGDRANDFICRGFVQKLRDHGAAIDVIAVDAHLGYYLDRSVVTRLKDDIITPLRPKTARIWLMGISLGGTGALLYLRDHPADISGILLLAPFLGSRELIAQIGQAGGLKQWQSAEIKPDDEEGLLLAWLKDYPFRDSSLPRIYLGYGVADRFAPASVLIAEQLPSTQILTVEGGHNWATWLTLWQQFLAQGIFSGSGKTGEIYHG